MKKIKGTSSKWINEQKRLAYKFGWQEGYGVFSVSESQVPTLVRYVKEQEKHHRTFSFKEEFMRILELNKLEYNEEHLWN